LSTARGQGFQLVEDPPALDLVGREGPRAVALIRGDVGAGDEVALSGSGQDHRPHRLVGGEGIERGVEGADKRGRQGVELFRPVEGEPHDARLDVVAEWRAPRSKRPLNVKARRLQAAALLPSPVRPEEVRAGVSRGDSENRASPPER